MPKSNKKKGQSSKLVFYKAPHIQEPTINKHRHTVFSSDAAGNLTQKSTTLLVPSCTTAPGNAEDNLASPLHCDDLNTGYDIPNINEDHAFTDPLFDAAYIAHLEEIGADAKIKRVRPKGVCHFRYWALNL